MILPTWDKREHRSHHCEPRRIGRGHDVRTRPGRKGIDLDVTAEVFGPGDPDTSVPGDSKIVGGSNINGAGWARLSKGRGCTCHMEREQNKRLSEAN
jgi:hypothetical protein